MGRKMRVHGCSVQHQFETILVAVYAYRDYPFTGTICTVLKTFEAQDHENTF